MESFPRRLHGSSLRLAAEIEALLALKATLEQTHFLMRNTQMYLIAFVNACRRDNVHKQT